MLLPKHLIDVLHMLLVLDIELLRCWLLHFLVTLQDGINLGSLDLNSISLGQRLNNSHEEVFILWVQEPILKG
jgi:hypothetical protein